MKYSNVLFRVQKNYHFKIRSNQNHDHWNFLKCLSKIQKYLAYMYRETKLNMWSVYIYIRVAMYYRVYDSIWICVHSPTCDQFTYLALLMMKSHDPWNFHVFCRVIIIMKNRCLTGNWKIILMKLNNSLNSVSFFYLSAYMYGNIY